MASDRRAPVSSPMRAPAARRPWAPLDWACAVLCAALALAVYGYTLAPTVSGEDSGELVIAAYTLGVAHPPGYPLWCLLGKLFTFIPFGSIAWRVNLLSAVFGAFTVGLLYGLARRWCDSRLAAAAAALAFAFSAEFWEQAVIAEVYTLNNFFVVLCLLLLALWRVSQLERYLYAFAVAYGLSLCNHHTMLLLGPVFVAFVLWTDAPRLLAWRPWATYAGCTAAALACLAIYAYLPLRAMADPPVNWGNPDTWARFWAHVTRQQYASVLAEDPRTLANAAAQLWEYLKLYAGEYTLWLCWLPALGAWVLWSRARWAFGLLLAVFLVAGPGMALLLNFTIDRQSLWLNNVFWIPSYLAASVFLGLALEWLALRAPRPGVQRALLALALVLCTSVPLVSHCARNTKRHYHYAEDFGRNLLASLPENAIYFPTADHATFPVLYLQVAEGLRPDVTLANKYGYPERSVFKDMPQDFINSLPGVPNKGQEQYIEDWVIQHSGRPVYFTRKRTLEGLPDYQLVQAGLTFAVIPKSAAPPARDYWAEYTWRGLDLDATQGELSATYILSDYHYMRGREALERGELDAAKEALDLAATAGGDSKELLNNIASAYAEANVLDAAEDFYKRTLAVDPAYTTARKNLAKTYLQRDRAEEAILVLEEALLEDPKDPDAIRLSAQALSQIGWKEEAIERYAYLVELYPQDAEGLRELGMLYVHHRKDPVTAKMWFTRSIEADPGQDGIAEMQAALTAPASEEAAPEDLEAPPMPVLPDLRAGLPPPMPTPDAPLPQFPGMPGPAAP